MTVLATGLGTRLLADHLITMEPGVPVHSPGIVDVLDGRVTWSGPAAAAPPSDAKVQTVSGLLMPGLISAHAHTPMVLLRGTGEGLATIAWLHDVMWPRESRLTADDVEWAMRLGASELLLHGVTTSSEMYFWPAAIARAAADAGLRCLVAAPLLESPGFAHHGTIAEQID
ncbi:MAG TPA: amidohydrolase family protein, partial [Ilumatobacteraceae bacterium]|nr:amidohydrolase family protein [Ilumatobacteraceae bacterium]